MGASMAFYHIKNNGFDREQLQTIMGKSFPQKDELSDLFEKMKAAHGEDRLRQMWPNMEQDMERAKQWMEERRQRPAPFGLPRRPQLPSPMIGYCENAPWLPFFDVAKCEGYNASSKDARRLSKAFGTPVLAISIFDSDILLVSYSDAAKKIDYDYAKPNIEGMEEYDTGLFQTEFPQFLVDFCPDGSEEKLKEIWNGDEVFADDRMYKLGEVLGLAPINAKVPEGFEVITES